MPYYVLKYENTAMAKLGELELLEEFEVFKDASKFSKAKRNELPTGDNHVIKVMFADNLLTAEEKVREKREPQPSDD